ncbi:hypothetical protein L7F22_002970 [Adiantum nelumboides]|nr:hypothetical protein [Adiantum nelumboides]
MGVGGGSTLHTILGVSGNIVTIAFFTASTLKSAWSIVRQKGTSNIVSCWGNQLFLFMLFNCLLWVFYGLPINRPHNFWIILTNSIGAILALVAVGAYYHYTSCKEKLIVEWELESFAGFFMILILTTIWLNTDRETRVFVVGTICVVFSSLMHLALLSELATAWSNKDLRRLHPIPSITAFLKGAIWTAYGWSGNDVFIVIPNGVGVATGVIQVILCIVIRRNIHKIASKGAETPDASETIHSQELAIAETKLNILRF